eukprot:scaffold227962_cov19-Tisochrysis_lutea.AAC.1
MEGPGSKFVGAKKAPYNASQVLWVRGPSCMLEVWRGQVKRELLESFIQARFAYFNGSSQESATEEGATAFRSASKLLILAEIVYLVHKHVFRVRCGQ